MATRWLYLHGYGSGPDSKKGRAFEARFGACVRRLDLRVPSFRDLRYSAMVELVRGTIGVDERVVLVGSSLGGLVAARVAEGDPRVAALVLLAPAFDFASWRSRNPAAAAAWERDGVAMVTDHTTGELREMSVGFLHDLEGHGAVPDVGATPTLVFHGRTDTTVGIDASRAWVAGRPTRRLVELDDGHELVASLPRILDESAGFLAPWTAPAS